MEKNSVMKKLLNQYKEIFQEYQVTLITTVLFTIFYTIVVDDNNWREYNRAISHITTFFIIFLFSSFLVESKFNSKSLTFRISAYVVSVVASLILTIAVNYDKKFLGISKNKFEEYALRITVCYILSIFIYSVYSLYKKKNININEYLVRISMSLFKTGLIYGILAIGCSLICLAYITLIMEGRGHLLFLRVNILLFGIFFTPKGFFGLTAIEDEIGKFAKTVIKYVLGILVISAFAVIYIYMLKILILWKLPSNEIYRITAGLFILGCPIWVVVSYFKDNDILEKINSKLPYAFIPFVFLQMYSIGVRIYNFGLTPGRYMCVALILFEVIYFIVNIFDKEKLRAMFYSLIAIILISGIAPYVNMFKLSEISQTYIIKSALKSKDKENILKYDKKVVGAYKYLISINGGKEIVNSLFTDEEEKLIKDNRNYDGVKSWKDDDTIKNSLSATIDLKELNIDGYKKIYVINKNYIGTKFDETLDASKLVVHFDDGKKVNIEPLISEYKKQSEEDFGNYFRKHNEYVVDDNLKIVLDDCYIRTNEKNELKSCSIEGFVLEK